MVASRERAWNFIDYEGDRGVRVGGGSVVPVGSVASQGRSSSMLRADILGKFRVRNAQFVLVNLRVVD